MISTDKTLMKKTFLTNQLVINFSTLPAGSLLEITEKADFRKQCYFTLKSPSLAIEQENFLLKACLNSSAANYCIIGYPQKFDDEQFETALIVLKVLSGQSLETISEGEMQQIAEKCQQTVAGGPLLISDATAMFGQFEED
jgi:hypothetical protein